MAPIKLENGVLVSSAPEVFREAPGGGGATYDFALPAGGNQTLWALVKTPNPDADSWHLNVDGQQSVVNDKVTGQNWGWISMGDFDVKAGANTLTISQREPNARIKALRWGGTEPTTQQNALLKVAGRRFRSQNQRERRTNRQISWLCAKATAP